MDSVNDYSFKELYDVVIKTTYPIEINGISYKEGEVITVFDKIALVDFSENKEFITAHGGYEDRDRVFWETTREVSVNFTQGVFSKLQYAMMANSRLIKKQTDTISIHQRDVLESDENNVFYLSHVPNNEPIYVYCAEHTLKLEFTQDPDNKQKITITSPYTDVVVDYSYNYIGQMSIMTVGETLFKGFVSLQGKTRIKDDVTGHTVTALINIPKLRLTSRLSMRLGKNANPVVGHFSALACPTGARGNSKVVEIIYLTDDVDSDM